MLLYNQIIHTPDYICFGFRHFFIINYSIMIHNLKPQKALDKCRLVEIEYPFN